MKNLKIVTPTLLLFAALVGIVYALTPPPPPPPPVPQNIGIFDTSIDLLKTNATDQSACRVCHQTSDNIGGYNNTVGGVPTRHHNMLPEGVINPFTNITFRCQDCHPSIPGIGNGILLDRSCANCHNGTAFWADSSLGAYVGNFSRPHHVDTGYDDANIGQPAQLRDCKLCHGSFVDNYNDGHYKPSYDTQFTITPYATFKITNFSQSNPIPVFNSSGAQVLDKTWGGCESCHLANPNATPLPISSNRDNHHKEILGFAKFGGQTRFQNASTPFVGVSNICSVCHVIDYKNSTGHGATFPLMITLTNPNPTAHRRGVEILTNAMEVRNSTIELADAAIGAFEPGTTNITINGTGCEKCHSVQSLLKIQFNYVEDGPQGFGHINNNTDCYGCHNSWLPANTFVPSAIPIVYSVNPSVIIAGSAATLTITGSNFGNDISYVVTVDGVKYTPTSITDTQIVVKISALIAGIHQLQLVEGGALSKLFTLTVVPNSYIKSASLNNGVLTITGSGFGTMPLTTPQYYVSVRDTSGNQIVSTSVLSWSNKQIQIVNSAAHSGSKVTVLTANSGETTGTIQ